MVTKHDYRLKVASHNGNTYITRHGKNVQYMSGNETPLALSNLLGGLAAETRFKLEDARDGADAQHVLQIVLHEQWKGNPGMCPKVTII